MINVPVEAVYAMDAALQKRRVCIGRVTLAEARAALALHRGEAGR